MPSKSKIEEAKEKLQKAEEAMKVAQADPDTDYVPGYTYNEKGSCNGIDEHYWQGHFADVGDVLYEATSKKFFVFDDGIWSVASMEEVRDRLDRHIRCNTPEDACINLGRVLKGSPVMAVVYRLMGDRRVVRRNAFLLPPAGILLVENGRVEIKPDGTHAFTEERGRREDMQTTRLPLRYDPKVKALKTLAWLRRIFAGREDDVFSVVRFLGACAWGRNEWKTLFMVLGKSNYGKSRIIGLASRICGYSRAEEIDMKHLGEKFETDRFVGKILLTMCDVPSDFLSTVPANRLKAMTGGEEDRLRTLGKWATEGGDMRGTFLAILTANDNPRVKPNIDTSGWASRCKIVVANGEAYEGAEQDSNFLNRYFAEEGSGILNLALEGIALLRSDGHWKQSEDQICLVKAMLETSDNIIRWTRDCLAEGLSDPDRPGVTTGEAWASYLMWCKDRRIEPWLQNTFVTMAMESVRNVFGKGDSNSIPRGETVSRGWRGMRLKSEVRPENVHEIDPDEIKSTRANQEAA